MRLQDNSSNYFESSFVSQGLISLNDNHYDFNTNKNDVNWTKGLSACLTAMEQAAPYFIRDPQTSFVHLQCTESDSSNSLNKKIKIKSKRARECSPENSFSQEPLEIHPFKAPYKTFPSTLSTNTKGPNKYLVTKQALPQVKKMLDGNSFATPLGTKTFCQLLNTRLEELSVDSGFINWVQSQAKTRGLGSQDFFDILRSNLLEVYVFTDNVCYLLRVSSVSNCSDSLSGSNFSELRSLVQRAIPYFDWVISNLSDTDINLIAPSWSYIFNRFAVIREYTDVLEDMLQLPSNSVSSQPGELLSYFQSKLDSYKDILKEQGRNWQIMGLPSCSQLLESVKNHLISITSRSISSILFDPRDSSRQAIIFDETLNNWIDCFKAGLLCIQLVGSDHGNIQSLLFQLLAQLLMSSAHDLDIRLSREKKDKRGWELWLLARIDLIAGHLNDLTRNYCPSTKFSERSILGCVQTMKNRIEGNTEASMCFALVDLILRVVHALTCTSVCSEPTFSNRRGFIAPTNSSSMNFKPSSYLLFAQIIRLFYSALTFANSPSLDSRAKVLAEHLDLSLC